MKSLKARTAAAGLAAVVATVGLAGTSFAQSDSAPGDEPPAPATEPANSPDGESLECVQFFEDVELPAEIVDEINAETDALVVYLAENDLTIETETYEDGTTWVDIDDADEATWALVDQFYVDLYGEGPDEEFFDEDLDIDFMDDFEIPAEIVDEINAETDALVVYLAENDLTVETETYEDGTTWVDIDDADEATWALVDQFYDDLYGEGPDEEFFDDFGGCDELFGDFELSNDEITEFNTETDALVAELADAGIVVGVDTDEDGLRFPLLDDLGEDGWGILDDFFAPGPELEFSFAPEPADA